MTDTPQYKCFLLKDRCIFVYSLFEVPVGCRVYATFDDEHNASEWCTEHNKFAEVACAWEEGKQIQFKSHTGEWKDCTDNQPYWYRGLEYRVSPDQKVNKLAEAKEIIRKLLVFIPDKEKYFQQASDDIRLTAEQFLKEVEE